MLDGNDSAEIYRELRKIAAIHLSRAARQPSLQPTVLVHEVWLRLSGRGWKSRTHFLALASRAMRGILVDMARARLAAKRVAPVEAVSIGMTEGPDTAANLLPIESVIEVSRLLDELASEDTRKAQVVELRFFGGLEFQEIAECLAISLATAKRDWEFSRLWLFSRLNSPASDT
jgi:RNA polymerase sigma factor (TIGR02999 family)